jgi:hypothetical protein
MNDINKRTERSASDLTMNDTLPTSNPSLKTVLFVLALAIIAALILYHRSSFGF